MLNRRTVIQASLGGGLVAVLAGLAAVGHERVKLGPTDGAGWRPVAWPFPRDGWPPGRGWRRDTTDVYVRPKPAGAATRPTSMSAPSSVSAAIARPAW